jgi:heterodisulfide reductase subunit A
VEKALEIIEDQIGKSLADSIRNTFADSNFGDVMVVGGGVSGVQASLDLASAGFKVYLVDKAPAIGGHMAQLDKTFPTNDCSI